MSIDFDLDIKFFHYYSEQLFYLKLIKFKHSDIKIYTPQYEI